jgi:non-ribosomal peptide synthase protein (TIGR01720 family)
MIHHLVVDGVSWRILLGDLETAYEQLRQGRPVDLAPTGTGYLAWAQRLSQHAGAGGFDHDRPFWSATSYGGALPVDRAGDNTAGSARTVTVRLDAARTDALLRAVPPVYRTRINDVLLAALGRVLARWTGGDRVTVALEGHGREDVLPGVDLDRTVGWFTTEFPVTLTVPSDQDWGHRLMGVKEHLRTVPSGGVSHGALDLTGATPEVSFNYLGQWAPATPDGLYRRWHETAGQDVDPASRRPYLVDITGIVADGELELGWTYSDQVHDEATIQRRADEFVAALDAIIDHCGQPGAGGRTPSDFPLARLDQAQLDTLDAMSRTCTRSPRCRPACCSTR